MEAHLRIDEGVKRGPRKPRNPIDPQTKRFLSINGQSQSIALQKRSQILERLAAGELLRDIAADLNVNPGAISAYLAKDQDYIAARESGLEQQLEIGQGQIAQAEDPLNLARGREAFRATAWRCEREFPHRWAQRQLVDVKVTVDVEPELLTAGAKLIESFIEGEVVVSSEQQGALHNANSHHLDTSEPQSPVLDAGEPDAT